MPRRIPDIRWHDFARNADIRRITNHEPPLSSITKSRCLTFFGHLARMDENSDASQAVFEPAPENWRRPPGRPRTTCMKNIHDDHLCWILGIYEARDLVQNRPLWTLETDVFAHALYSLVEVHATIGLDTIMAHIHAENQDQRLETKQTDRRRTWRNLLHYSQARSVELFWMHAFQWESLHRTKTCELYAT